MTPFALYNGASGALGRYLEPAFVNRGVVTASVSSRLGDATGLEAELALMPIEPGSPVTFVQGAAMVSVRDCEEHPATAFEVNVTRTMATIGAVAEWAAGRDSPLRVVFVSSGHVYAAPEPGNRLTESASTRPQSVYAQTKLEGEEQIAALGADHDLDLVIARVFGMIAPGQSPEFLVPGLITRIRTGDLAAVPGLDYIRDYLDARDVARHLASLAVDPIAALDGDGTLVVNVCSGEETRIGDLLDALLDLSYRSDPGLLAEARRLVGSAPGRPTDIEWSVGDPALLSQITPGLIRSIPIPQTLTDALAEQS
jgi:nucleoside-diphosphate-sugar epimerase